MFQCLMCEATFVSEKKLQHHILVEKHTDVEIELEEQVVPLESEEDNEIHLENPILGIDLENPLANVDFELLYID